jgi:hypothetical protein
MMEAKGPETGFAEVNGTKLYFEVSGDRTHLHCERWSCML